MKFRLAVAERGVEECITHGARRSVFRNECVEIGGGGKTERREEIDYICASFKRISDIETYRSTRLVLCWFRCLQRSSQARKAL